LSFFIWSLLAIGIGAALGIYHGRERRVEAIRTLAGLYSGVIFLASLSRAVLAPLDQEALFLCLGSGLAFSAWGWLSWRRPQKFSTRAA
jgi:hypothetical protein